MFSALSLEGRRAWSCEWKSADMWLRVLLPSLSELWICYICSAVRANASCLRPRSGVKWSAFIAHQESRSALTRDALFWVSNLIWPGIKHVWHPVLHGLPLKLFKEVSRARNISADILNKASVNSGYLRERCVLLSYRVFIFPKKTKAVAVTAAAAATILLSLLLSWTHCYCWIRHMFLFLFFKKTSSERVTRAH